MPRWKIASAKRRAKSRARCGRSILHLRTIIYLTVWGGIGLGLLFALGTRSRTDLTVAQDRNPPFMLMSDGSIRNAYTLKLRNMESRPRGMEVSIEGLPGAVMWTDDMPREAARTARSRAMSPPTGHRYDARLCRARRRTRKRPANSTFTLRSLDEQDEKRHRRSPLRCADRRTMKGKRHEAATSLHRLARWPRSWSCFFGVVDRGEPHHGALCQVDLRRGRGREFLCRQPALQSLAGRGRSSQKQLGWKADAGAPAGWPDVGCA